MKRRIFLTLEDNGMGDSPGLFIRLRQLLKIALRGFGLRCTDVKIERKER